MGQVRQPGLNLQAHTNTNATACAERGLRSVGDRDDPWRLRQRRSPQSKAGRELRTGHAHRQPKAQRIHSIRAHHVHPKRERDLRSGDTISGIATRTGLWPLSAWSVPSGNIVTYRGTATTASGSVATGGRVHVVKSGETLSGIFGATGWQCVTQLNNLANPNLIYPGQRLRY